MLGAYVAQPLFWLLPAVVGMTALGAARREWRETQGYLLPAVCFGAVLVMAQFATGLAFGFGTSPYSHSPRGIALIVWYTLSILIARELVRWTLFRALRGRNEELAMVAAWLLLFLTDVAPRVVLFNLSDPSRVFEFAGRTLLPVATAGLVATYLMSRGGPLPAIAFNGLMALFMVLSPILPDVPWTVMAFMGVVMPLMGLMVLQLLEEPLPDEELLDEIGPSPRLLVMAFVVVTMFWINTGIFGFQPMIVHGISMQPVFHTGDLVLTKHVPAAELREGDIIQFRVGRRDVFHRIIEVQQGSGSPVFITKGDNMPAPDSPVPAAHVRGRLLWHVPKAGLPVAHVKEYIGRFQHWALQ
jgi:signal peptidase I